MEKVTCTNDKNLPQGASVVEGTEYTIINNYVNNWGQRVYEFAETKNEGITDKGLMWKGYAAERFSKLENVKSDVQYEFALN